MAEQKRSNILVVDDAEVNIEILIEFLGGEYDVVTATDGPQALDITATAPPDIILLDVVMPGMDGFEVCRRLKSDEKTADIPIIFITALEEVAAETRGLALGAIDFITKPFNPGVVRARVANHLALREAIRLKEDVERIMRHDLKSPLTTVITLPQLLLMDENLDAPQRGMLRRIEDAGYTIMAMINLSTTLFRMERDSYELKPEEMDLVAVTRKVLAGFAETAAMRRIELQMLPRRSGEHPLPGRGTALPLHALQPREQRPGRLPPRGNGPRLPDPAGRGRRAHRYPEQGPGTAGTGGQILREVRHRRQDARHWPWDLFGQAHSTGPRRGHFHAKR